MTFVMWLITMLILPILVNVIRNIPKGTETLEDIISVRWTIQDLKENDRLQKERISLKDVMSRTRRQAKRNWIPMVICTFCMTCITMRD